MNQDKTNERSRISDIHKSFYKSDADDDTDPDHDSDSDNSYESMNDSNIIFANLNKPLYDLFALSPLSQPKTPVLISSATAPASVINTWIPPTKHGLSNCQSIVPNYYARSYKNILDIDYLTIIKDDIKNCRVLNDYQMEYIQSLNNCEKQELFVLFNQCVQMFNDYVLFEKPERDDDENECDADNETKSV